MSRGVAWVLSPLSWLARLTRPLQKIWRRSEQSCCCCRDRAVQLWLTFVNCRSQDDCNAERPRSVYCQLVNWPMNSGWDWDSAGCSAMIQRQGMMNMHSWCCYCCGVGGGQVHAHDDIFSRDPWTILHLSLRGCLSTPSTLCDVTYQAVSALRDIETDWQTNKQTDRRTKWSNTSAVIEPLSWMIRETYSYSCFRLPLACYNHPEKIII